MAQDISLTGPLSMLMDLVYYFYELFFAWIIKKIELAIIKSLLHIARISATQLNFM